MYEGKGIKRGNKIIYKDGKIITKVVIGDILKIFRSGEYDIFLNLKEGIKLSGTYKTCYGNFNIVSYARKIDIKKNSLYVIYDLIIDEHFVDTFTYNLEYSIDR